jgi:hypothetical protein
VKVRGEASRSNSQPIESPCARLLGRSPCSLLVLPSAPLYLLSSLLCCHDSVRLTIHSPHHTTITLLCCQNILIELAKAIQAILANVEAPTIPLPSPRPRISPHNTIIMFARRLAKSSSAISAPSSLIRTFASTSALCRTPALADITPEGVKSFDAKQKEFRERIAEQSKRKDPSQSRAYSNSSPSIPFSWPITPTAPSASTARSPSSNCQPTQALGSHKSSSSAELAPEEESGRKGKLSSLIYGTKEGREMDREIEHSFSQVLARGKYVHSIVFHEVKPDKVDEYVELVGNWYPRMASLPENKVHLVGSWRTEVGDCDTFGTS